MNYNGLFPIETICTMQNAISTVFDVYFVLVIVHARRKRNNKHPLARFPFPAMYGRWRRNPIGFLSERTQEGKIEKQQKEKKAKTKRRSDACRSVNHQPSTPRLGADDHTQSLADRLPPSSLNEIFHML